MNNTDSKLPQPNDPVGPRNPGPVERSMSGLTGPAADLKQQLAILHTLSASPFHRHFLERFLDGLGRWLGIPWWGVHALLYGLTLALFIGLGHVQMQFPQGGYLALSGTAAEFVATTYLLWYLRRSRTEAFLVAARITSARERLLWLRRYWGPMHWGWLIPVAPPRGMEPPASRGRRFLVGLLGPVFRVRIWGVSVLLLGLFYITLWLGWHPGPYGAPRLRFPHELCVYTDFAKAAAIVILLANFWMLHGLMRIAKGHCLSSSSRRQLRDLLYHCQRSTLQISGAAAVGTGGWLFAYGLDHGFTQWSFFWSFGLAVLFLTHRLILNGLPRRPFSFPEALGQVPAWVHLALRQAPMFTRPATQLAVLASIGCPIALNLLGAFMGGALPG